MMVVESAGCTDIGRTRKENEDSLFLDDDLGLYLVADGMGGHRAGGVASKLVVDTIRDAMFEYHENRYVAELGCHDRTLSPEANHLLDSIRCANEKVNRLAAEEPSYRRMGSTVSAAYFANGSMIVANVGDSPIWLVHEGEIEMLSVEHTVLGEQLATAHGEGKDASRAFNHMLTRAIGVEPTVKADVSEVPCFAGDILVMASDGLSNKVPAQEILELTSRETPQTVCRLLVELANERGGEDNITVIVAKVKAVQRGRRGFVRAIRQVIREYCGVWWKEKE